MKLKELDGSQNLVCLPWPPGDELILLANTPCIRNCGAVCPKGHPEMKFPGYQTAPDQSGFTSSPIHEALFSSSAMKSPSRLGQALPGFLLIFISH
jgi:hypothetical protein